MRLNACPRREGRRASASLELLFALPLLFAMIVAVLQFSMVVTAQHELAAACREGARAAARHHSEEEVRKIVRDFLGEGRLKCAKIHVRIRNDSHELVCSGEPVEVMMEIPTRVAVPNFLAFIGFCFAEENLVARTVMRKE